MRTLSTMALLAMLGASAPGCVNTAVLASIPSDAEDDMNDATEPRDTTEPHDVIDDHEGKHLDDVLGTHDDDQLFDDH